MPNDEQVKQALQHFHTRPKQVRETPEEKEARRTTTNMLIAFLKERGETYIEDRDMMGNPRFAVIKRSAKYPKWKDILPLAFKLFLKHEMPKLAHTPPEEVARQFGQYVFTVRANQAVYSEKLHPTTKRPEGTMCKDAMEDMEQKMYPQ